MTEKRKRFLPLRYRFRVTILFALAMGFLLGVGVRLLGEYLIETVYLAPDRAAARSQALMDSFQAYAGRKQMSSRDIQAVAGWSAGHRHTFLVITGGGEVVLDYGWLEGREIRSPEDLAGQDLPPGRSQTEEAAPGQASRIITFADGDYQVRLYDFTQEPLQHRARLLGYLTATVAVVVIMGLYHRSVIRKIVLLNQQVRKVALGNVYGEITVTRGDELGQLSQHISAMRDTVMEKTRGEQEAWQANSDLITRLSHDIRTPLTVLLGFLELLDEGEFSDSPVYQDYLTTCRRNAFQLKELADKMFRCFLVFGKGSFEMKPEVVNVKTLLSQCIGEHVMLMQEKGWKLDLRPLGMAQSQVKVRVDPVYLKRLFDNLFSNIEKYADPAAPVSVSAALEGERIHVTLNNAVRANPNPAERTGIGLRTCEQIVRLMDGAFFARQEEDVFRAEFYLPVIP